MPVHLGLEDGGEEASEEADRAHELEGEEEFHLSEVLAARCQIRGICGFALERWAQVT